jgi:ferrous iron transport protein A
VTAGGSPAYPLALAAPDERVRITLLRGGRGLAERLASMGLSVGTELSVASSEGGAMVVAREGTRLALGAGMAHKVMVVPAG